MKGIVKRFGPVVANDDINISINRGEILALLGENGSGKTTLMNMLSGIYQPDEGEIYVNGKQIYIHSPKDAYVHGIGMIHQHYKLIEVFSAAVTGDIGPDGQISEHLVHSGLHHPFSKDISGCIRVIRFPDGLSTWFGQTDTQSWHAVQCAEKCLRLSEPAGFKGVFRAGAFFSCMAASPPSTFISWALTATAVTARAAEARKARLPLS